MKDTDWQIINELYKTRNITKAANSLFIAQPTLTKRLQYIEDELGITLTIRSARGLIFTAEGEYIAKQAQKYLRFWQATRTQLENYRNNQYGTLRTVSAYTFVKYHIGDFLEPFQTEHPNVSVDIRTERSDMVERCLLEGNADVAFVRGDYGNDFRRSVVTKERAHLISKEEISLQDLPSRFRIDSIWGEYTRSLLDRWWAENFSNIPRVNMVLREADTCWQMVKRGLGYTVSFLSDKTIRQLGVHAIPLSFADGTPMVRNTWFLYSKDFSHPEYVDDFIHIVEKRILSQLSD